MFLVFKNRYENIENIINENFGDKIFDILYCYYHPENILYLSLCLKKEYCNITPKTKRYIQLNITNDKIELYEEHKKEYIKEFYDKYKEQLEYLCSYIKENKYYENIKYNSNNNNNVIFIYSNFLHFDMNINNELELNCSYRNIENDNLNDYFKIYYNHKKLSKKTKKANLTPEEILKNTLIKREEITLKVLEEIEILNQVKAKKKMLV